MRRHIQIAFLACTVLLCCALPAQAATKTYTVLPFSIHGPEEYRYLSEGIRSMLVSRLGWEENFESTGSDVTDATASEITDKDAARSLRQDIGTDYLVWGSATISGDQASLDVSMLGPEETTTKSRETDLNELIPAMEELSNELSNEVFGKPEPDQSTEEKNQTQKSEGQENQTQPSGAANENFVVNESNEEGSSLNPQFQYQSDSASPGRWRSQSLPFTARGMAIGDADGDGNTEYFFLEENAIRVYRKKQNRLIETATYEADRRDTYLNINLFDSNDDGIQELYISAVSSDRVRSFILEFQDGQFQMVEDKLNYFLNVVRTPPEYRERVVAQRKGSTRLFQGDVHELVKMSGEHTLGPTVNLPDKANVFNFTFLPFEDSYRVILVNNRNHLVVYNDNNNPQHRSEEIYAGSSIGLEVDESMPGLGQDRDREPKFYYLPHQPIIANLDGGDSFELIADRSISVSAQIFERYRHFPQGEIHSLFWDGVGLNIEWKTRTIKGSVISYDIIESDSDGQLKLAVGINTHPGATGFSSPKTLLLLYDLGEEAQTAEEILHN
ncbi:MAG: VCBS repeat-containing protein [Desulfohalobium sp.]